MVKDHRTNHEEGNTEAVLDGELDPFIEAYLREQVGE
jgi:peptide chain release factor 2